MFLDGFNGGSDSFQGFQGPTRAGANPWGLVYGGSRLRV